MFSGSSSYLGGGPGGRPGQQQSGGFPGQQQQGGFGTQQTGFGQQPQQQQYTGFPGAGGGLQPQATGFPQQQQPQQQQQYGGFQPQQTGFQQPQMGGFPSQPTGLQPQATGFPQQQQQQFGGQQNGLQPPAPTQKPQQTGITSNDMANSFRSSPAQTQQPSQAPSSGTKIPNVRLSFITSQDQAKFEQLFKSAVGGEQALSGEDARDLLLRSKLDGNSLAEIWTLCDTTKSGALLFPEFALAMYLCNLKLTGKQLPSTLPENIRNEVSSMVDVISFGVGEDDRQRTPQINEPPKIQQPQPQQPNNTQLMQQLTAQPTGYQIPQATGYQRPMQSQPTGFQPQSQFGQQQQAQNQQTGYNGPRPPMPPMPTGLGPNQGLSPQQTAYGGGPAQPLNAQPTGAPGQWGLVNAPSSGLPNLQALSRQMMPQPGREAGFSAQGLRGNATVPWAVTKDEKKIYDDMFRAWDGFGKGFVSGNQAIEIFGQSGLEKPDLERIWTLSDPHNKGRLNLDEFAVAMHLIYRRLNGYPVPDQLPPELVPPSTRNLDASIGTMKNLLSQDASERKSTGAFLQPQKTGVSYLKSHSLRGSGQPSAAGRKDATMFKNDDNDVGYRSSARRRVREDGRSPSPAQSDSGPSADDMNIEQLKKAIREKQVLLDSMDFEDEGKVEEEDALDRKDRKESEDLFRRIRRIQEDIDGHPGAVFKTSDSDAERRSMQRQLRGLQDRLPELASHVRKCERAIADAQLELFRLKDAKANPGAASAIVGTGPGGAVTESDRLKARARAMMQQRSAALSGKKVETGDDGSAAAQRLEEESKRVTRDREDNEKMVRDVEDSVTEFSKNLEQGLMEGGQSASDEHEKRRWEDGLGVEDEVKDFIFDLQRSSRSARVRNEEKSRPRAAERPQEDNSRMSGRNTSPQATRTAAAPSQPSRSGSYNNYKTAEERAASIKQQAEQRMAERLAALGLKAPSSKGGETSAQRAERERKERQDRLKQAEEEDSKRERERQARLQDEGITPPESAAADASKPKSGPPPPAPRKPHSESLRSDQEQKKAEHQIKEQAIKEQQDAMADETKDMEDEEARQEREIQKQREESAASLKALEEQVKAGKLRKAEEKKKREAAKKEASEREARLAKQREEIEASKERERLLRAQLENIDDEDDSSDEDGEPAPAASTEPARNDSQPAAPAAADEQAGTSPQAQSKNPFFRSMSQHNTNPTQLPTVTSPDATEKRDTNPFHRLSTDNSAPKNTSQPLPAPAQESARRTKKPADDDDWSVLDSDDSDSDNGQDDDGPQGGSAKQLASILFGTMAPPRPLSAMDQKKDESAATSPAPVSSPPPPPPMPPSNGAVPSAPPPPPPPMSGSDASAGAPPAPPPPPPPSGMGARPAPGGGAPPDVSGLLGQIQAGKGLKKTTTKDRSQSSVAGRVL